jgi:hypothetical protein
VREKEKAMNETRLQASDRKSSWKEGGLGMVMGLILIAGAVLSIGGAPSTRAAARDNGSAIVNSMAPDAAHVANADRDVLDLQLD